MSNIGSYGHYSPTTQRRRPLAPREDITITVRSRNGGLQTTFCIEEPDAASVHELASICRQLFGHVAAVVRLILTLWVVPLKSTVAICRSLGKSFLGWLEGVLYNAPHQAQLLGNSVNSYISHRWPRLWGFMSRNTAPLFKVMQALMDYRNTMRKPTNTPAVRGSRDSMEDHYEDVILVRLKRRPSIPSPQIACTQNRRHWTQTLTSSALEDLPSLEELSMPDSMPIAALGSSSLAAQLHDANNHHQIETVPPERPSEHDASTSTICQRAEPSVAVFELSENSSPMINGTEESSIRNIAPPQGFPVPSIKSIQNPGDANLARSLDGTTAYNPDITIPLGSTSPVSSDPAGDETLSPVQLPLSHVSGNETQTRVSGESTNLWREGYENQRPPLRPITVRSISNPPINDRSTFPSSQYSPSTILRSWSSRSTTLSSCSPSLAKDASMKVTQTQQQSKRNSLDFHPGRSSTCYPNNEADYRGTRAASSCGEPHTSTRMLSRNQFAEADECRETCVSCATCDRRHKRIHRSSKIPRRIKTFEQFRARSRSRSRSRSPVSPRTIGPVGKKLQKKKTDKGH